MFWEDGTTAVTASTAIYYYYRCCCHLTYDIRERRIRTEPHVMCISLLLFRSLCHAVMSSLHLRVCSAQERTLDRSWWWMVCCAFGRLQHRRTTSKLNYSDHVLRKLNNFRGISQLLLFVNFYHYFFVSCSCYSRTSSRCASTVLCVRFVLFFFYLLLISFNISPEDNYSFEIENLNLITHKERTHTSSIVRMQKKNISRDVRSFRHVNENVWCFFHLGYRIHTNMKLNMSYDYGR